MKSLAKLICFIGLSIMIAGCGPKLVKPDENFYAYTAENYSTYKRSGLVRGYGSVIQLTNNNGESLKFNFPNIQTLPTNLVPLTAQELSEWSNSPRALFIYSHGKLKKEIWLFPDQSAIMAYGSGFKLDKYRITGNRICFSNHDSNMNYWCPTVSKSGQDYFFKDPDYSKIYWEYAHVNLFKSDLSGLAAFQLLRKGNGPEVLSSFTVADTGITAPVFVAKNGDTTSTNPVAVSKPVSVPTIQSITERNDDIAIIIGNHDYNNQVSNIPNVNPAANDSQAIIKYLTEIKNLSPDNILHLKNASQGDLIKTFGSHRSHKGTAYNWVKPNKSNLYVYYAGHGAPSEDGGMLVPTNAQYDSIELNGYPVQQLLANLSKIPSKSTTVILESCFSGISQAGSLVSNASPVYLKNGKSYIPSNINLITAAGPNQIASWQKDKRRSLFTKYLLEGLYGAADGDGYGNGDGKISQFELQAYLNDNLTYQARRNYGRDQNSQVQFTDGFAF